MSVAKHADRENVLPDPNHLRSFPHKRERSGRSASTPALASARSRRALFDLISWCSGPGAPAVADGHWRSRQRGREETIVRPAAHLTQPLPERRPPAVAAAV